MPAAWMTFYGYAWFASFGISFAVYAALMTGAKPGSRPARQAPAVGAAE